MDQPGQALSRNAYTPWLTRVLAFVVDTLPFVVIVGVGIGVQLGTRETLCAGNVTEYDIGPFCATGNTPLGVAAFLSSIVIGFAYLVWNHGYRQGRTGSSLGKSVMKFKVVSERTWQPVGFGASIVRQLAHVLDSLVCYVGYLFPLWDSKRQTIADKLVKTVCLPTR